MRLLITSLHFDAHPEGICTGRLVRALLSEGTEITVVTSEEADTSFTHPLLNYVVIQNILLPRKLFSLVNRITQTPGSYYFWCRRVENAFKRFRKPDLVYGRSSPISSVEAARRIANRLKLPFWAHYSDPFPMPWVHDQSPLFRRQAAYSRKVLSQAQAVTFTTREALDYSQRTLDIPLEQKSFVLQHIGPAPAWMPSMNGEAPVFAYIGSFYGKRNAGALLEAFSIFRRRAPGAKFVFVGSNPQWVLPDAERLGVSEAVTITPRVKDIKPYITDASVLVALDAECGEPVFMTTKIVEYLLANRPVLMVTAPNSPSARLVARFPETALSVREEPEAIAAAMAQAARIKADEAQYRRRFEGMHDFTPTGVARKFLSEVKLRAGI